MIANLTVLHNSISIHALLAESDPAKRICGLTSCISIHALLAESDICSRDMYRQLFNFYPRSPCGERHSPCQLWHGYFYFYPRSPCGERLMYALILANTMLFLSTLSLRRATKLIVRQNGLLPDFYPRSPCGERPHPVGVFITKIEISIHALLAESDRFLASLSAVLTISIHALLAESDLLMLSMAVILILFLSTLSLRRATCTSIGRPKRS